MALPPAADRAVARVLDLCDIGDLIDDDSVRNRFSARLATLARSVASSGATNAALDVHFELVFGANFSRPGG